MKRNTLYIILYYFNFLISIFLLFLPGRLLSVFVSNGWVIEHSFFSVILELINIIIVLVFTIFLLQKKKIDNLNVFFPITSIVFTLIIIGICFLFNDRLVIPYIHFPYYITFIYINYLLLNIYSVLSFGNNRKHHNKLLRY